MHALCRRHVFRMLWYEAYLPVCDKQMKYGRVCNYFNIIIARLLYSRQYMYT